MKTEEGKLIVHTHFANQSESLKAVIDQKYATEEPGFNEQKAERFAAEIEKTPYGNSSRITKNLKQQTASMSGII